jgi:hypothetical protein
MPVPFENLGPGQVGRLVYQVIGTDGPIFNPKNIAYLDPSSVVQTTANISAPAVGLSGASLIAGPGAVAISAATLKKCDHILRAITELAGDVAEMKETLQAVERRVKRIDTKVAETHLREPSSTRVETRSWTMESTFQRYTALRPTSTVSKKHWMKDFFSISVCA